MERRRMRKGKPVGGEKSLLRHASERCRTFQTFQKEAQHGPLEQKKEEKSTTCTSKECNLQAHLHQLIFPTKNAKRRRILLEAGKIFSRSQYHFPTGLRELAGETGKKNAKNTTCKKIQKTTSAVSQVGSLMANPDPRSLGRNTPPILKLWLPTDPQANSPNEPDCCGKGGDEVTSWTQLKKNTFPGSCRLDQIWSRFLICLVLHQPGFKKWGGMG